MGSTEGVQRPRLAHEAIERFGSISIASPLARSSQPLSIVLAQSTRVASTGASSCGGVRIEHRAPVARIHHMSPAANALRLKLPAVQIINASFLGTSRHLNRGD